MSFAIVFRTVGVSLIVLFLLSILWPVYYSQFRVTTTPQMMFYKFGEDDENSDLRVEYQWISLDSISRNIIVAALAAEDGDFYIHDGFSPIDGNDSTTSIIPRQHETITQKTAHAVFLTRGDSWAKDIFEPYFAVLEEYLWGKDRILEIYLNTCLLGNGVFGVEAASQIYFSKSAGYLTTQEAAFLAALLESPETIDVEQPSEEVLARQKNILMEMGLMMHIKVGKDPIDEKDIPQTKPIYRRKWRG